ncbi:MAG: prepilin-type N-terminal cleavage/methylation domain-containing protein [Bacilli bacterium]|nr:prepilin-type N-terminal cleavage/methylation domain-containing protein [Bacilli bacterium]MDD4734057.1 prepilin-type N-terminal cleavage/methylation domain-containing protein [Bacilli bacterium]MDD4734058.1 prepilin-type N-terminal cleavage/methylation domain-containing protein [Bacilli bacterium]
MKKGFTLIELLAVIVILAIIALIASPIVVGLIEDSNRQAAERSTEAVVQAAKTEFALSKLNKTTPSATAAGLDLDNAPTGGTVTYGSNGEITLSGVVFGKYTCTYTAAAGAKCS